MSETYVINFSTPIHMQQYLLSVGPESQGTLRSSLICKCNSKGDIHVQMFQQMNVPVERVGYLEHNSGSAT